MNTNLNKNEQLLSKFIDNLKVNQITYNPTNNSLSNSNFTIILPKQSSYNKSINKNNIKFK